MSWSMLSLCLRFCLLLRFPHACFRDADMVPPSFRFAVAELKQLAALHQRTITGLDLTVVMARQCREVAVVAPCEIW